MLSVAFLIASFCFRKSSTWKGLEAYTLLALRFLLVFAVSIFRQSFSIFMVEVRCGVASGELQNMRHTHNFGSLQKFDVGTHYLGKFFYACRDGEEGGGGGGARHNSTIFSFECFRPACVPDDNRLRRVVDGLLGLCDPVLRPALAGTYAVHEPANFRLTSSLVPFGLGELSRHLPRVLWCVCV